MISLKHRRITTMYRWIADKEWVEIIANKIAKSLVGRKATESEKKDLAEAFEWEFRKYSGQEASYLESREIISWQESLEYVPKRCLFSITGWTCSSVHWDVKCDIYAHYGADSFIEFQDIMKRVEIKNGETEK